jgi:hypothetical protein
MFNEPQSLLHIGGTFSGEVKHTPAHSPGLNYRTDDGTSYCLHILADGTEVMAESTLCHREVRMYLNYMRSQGLVHPLAPSSAPSVANEGAHDDEKIEQQLELEW